jgi:hypothetical protein
MMANIDVVPKHHSLTWVWIMIAAIVVIALWWILARSSAPGNQTGQLEPPPDRYGIATLIDTV